MEHGARVQFLQSVLVAREIQQVVDQLHQALHFFIDGIQQVGFAGILRKFRPLAKQAESHVHAGDRRSQLMGSPQDKLAAHPFERALFGDVMQHHHRAENMTLGMDDRRQAVGQQPRLTIDLDTQVFRRTLQRAAAQHQLQLFIQFGTFKGRAQPLAQTIGVPTQLALSHRIEVFKMTFAIDHQQAVVDAVEHGLQALLTGEQLVDVGGLVLTQCLGHDPETLGQQVQFHGGRNRQGHLEIALANIVGSLGQGFDRPAKTPGNRVGSHKPDDQHRQSHQPQQASHQQRALPGLALGVIDVIQRTLVFCEQTIAQRVEFFRECFVATQYLGRFRGLAVGLKKIQIVILGLFEPVRAAIAGLFEGDAFIEQLDVMLPGRLERWRDRAFR